MTVDLKEVTIVNLCRLNFRAPVPSREVMQIMLSSAIDGCSAYQYVDVAPISVQFDFTGDMDEAIDSVIESGYIVLQENGFVVTDAGAEFCDENVDLLSSEEIETIKTAKSLYDRD